MALTDTGMQQKLEWGCVGMKEALPGTGGQSLGYRALQRSWGHPKPLFPKSQQHGKRGVHVCAFWEEVILGIPA